MSDLLPRVDPDRPPVTWRLERLLSAPHRLAFAAAALMLATSAVWWATALLTRALGVAVPWHVAPPIAHALFMSFGFMPMFFAGFLFTAGPKWLALPAVAARELRAPVVAHLLGWTLFALALHAGTPGPARLLAALGLGVAAAAWTALWWRFSRLVRISRAADRLHARVAAAAGAVGAVLLWLAAVALAAGADDVVRAATRFALWAWIGITFTTMSHRMLPFFGSALPRLDARHPQWLLILFTALLGAEAVFSVVEPLAPVPASAARAAVEAPAALLLLALAWRWRRTQRLRAPLVVMLQIGFLWLGIAFALAAVSHALMAFSGGQRSLGLAPLHAYTMGFLASTMMAMVTRVSAAHSGRAVAVDDLGWRLFMLLQGAAVLRVIGAVTSASGPESAPMLALTALVWALATAIWATRIGRWTGCPRVDGRAG